MNQVFDKQRYYLFKIKNIYNNYDSNYYLVHIHGKLLSFEIGYSLSRNNSNLFSQYDINDYEGVQNIYRINK